MKEAEKENILPHPFAIKKLNSMLFLTLLGKRVEAAALLRDGKFSYCSASAGFPPAAFERMQRAFQEPNAERELVEALLAAGADPSAPCGQKEDFGFDWTPLTIAARENRVEGLRALLRAGGDARAKNGLGTTALEVAARNGHSACVELLLPSCGAFEPDGQGQSVLRRVVEQRQWGCADLLAREAPLACVVSALKNAPENAMPMARAALERAQLAEAAKSASAVPMASAEEEKKDREPEKKQKRKSGVAAKNGAEKRPKRAKSLRL